MSKDKLITYAEVAKHKTEDDLWVIYEDKVLDITHFLAEHPGGEDVLLEHAGGDLTQAFEDIGHSPEAKKQMDGYQVGKIDKNSPKPEKKKTSSLSTATGDGAPAPQNPFLNLILPILIVVLGVLGYYFYA